MSPLERDLIEECRVVAEAWGALLAQVGQRKARGSGTTKGFPDLVLVDSGQVRLIECKRTKSDDNPRGVLSLAQEVFIARAAEHGVHVYVIETLEEFVAVLRGCRKPRGVVRRDSGTKTGPHGR